MAGTSEVRWELDGQRLSEATQNAVAFVRRLFQRHGEAITDLEVRRSSLEDTYLAMVARFEAGDRTAGDLAEVLR